MDFLKLDIEERQKNVRMVERCCNAVNGRTMLQRSEWQSMMRLIPTLHYRDPFDVTLRLSKQDVYFLQNSTYFPTLTLPRVPAGSARIPTLVNRR